MVAWYKLFTYQLIPSFSKHKMNDMLATGEV